jgi:hypothetical protein
MKGGIENAKDRLAGGRGRGRQADLGDPLGGRPGSADAPRRSTPTRRAAPAWSRSVAGRPGRRPSTGSCSTGPTPPGRWPSGARTSSRPAIGDASGGRGPAAMVIPDRGGSHDPGRPPLGSAHPPDRGLRVPARVADGRRLGRFRDRRPRLWTSRPGSKARKIGTADGEGFGRSRATRCTGPPVGSSWDPGSWPAICRPRASIGSTVRIGEGPVSRVMPRAQGGRIGPQGPRMLQKRFKNGPRHTATNKKVHRYDRRFSVDNMEVAPLMPSMAGSRFNRYCGDLSQCPARPRVLSFKRKAIVAMRVIPVARAITPASPRFGPVRGRSRGPGAEERRLI